jgi:hypothetical protein
VSATTLVAIYAAVVATAGFAWQVYSWSREYATRIKVESSGAFLVSGGRLASEAMLMVRVANRSSHPVQIRSVGWVRDSQRSTSIPITQRPSPEATLPGTLRPRSQGESWVSKAELVEVLREAGIPARTKLRAYATDGEGHRHLSKAFPSV